MNKQEAIKTIEQDKIQVGRFTEITREVNAIRRKIEMVDYVPLEVVVSAINKINEPQKVVIPKFVAEWIEECKRSGWHLRKALYRLDDDDKIGDWAYDENDDLISEKVDTFARAWLDGYEVEKEPLYVVTDGNKLYLKEFDELNAVIVIDDVVWATDYAKRYSDKTEAQKAADELGWVVKEVE